MPNSPDQMILEENWSDLSQYREIPQFDLERMHAYRMGRIKTEMQAADVELCILLNPSSLRYAINYRNYLLFTAHIPSTYLFIAQNAPYRLCGAFDPTIDPARMRASQPISYFYGGDHLEDYAEKFAQDVVDYLSEIGSSNCRVAIEYVNPSITKAMLAKGLEVLDGVAISERARRIKSEDELACMRWSIAVAELGASQIQRALRPGVTETQLWGLLNYTNLANNGDWHDGRMLASGDRINPWLQEASNRRIESGDLVGFDTDMMGPMGYCADLSRTFHCGPAKPTARQKELYQLAMAEVEHNLSLIKHGRSFHELQRRAFPVGEQYQPNSYPCIVHGVGMCDEYPHLNPKFRGDLPYQGELQAGMVVCVESYMGAVGERDGVKLEQQVLVTDDGYELLTQFPYDERLCA